MKSLSKNLGLHMIKTITHYGKIHEGGLSLYISVRVIEINPVGRGKNYIYILLNDLKIKMGEEYAYRRVTSLIWTCIKSRY